MSALEKHYSVAEISALWGINGDTVRELFRDRFDVLKIGSPERRGKRRYWVLRIPESVMQKVHAELRGRRAA